MAVLDLIDTNEVANATYNPELIRQTIGKFFWLWFDQHIDDEVTTVSFWFIHRTIRVRDLREVFILLFGPQL